MKKFKKTMVIALAIIMALSITACGGGGGGEEEGSGELNIYMWSDYMSEGIIKDFEDEFGVKVNVSYINSTEEAVAKLSAGAGSEYDLVMPSDADMENLIKGGHLEEIDTASMDNFQYIDEVYKEKPFDPDNKWCVPYLVNYLYVVVNDDTCPVEIKTYDDLLDPALKGKLASVTGMRNMLAMGLVATGGDPNSQDEKEIEAAYEWLQKYMENVTYLNSDDAETALISETAVAGYLFDGMASRTFTGAQEGQSFSIPVLEDPIQLGVDEFVIPKDAKNKENAEKFLNFIMDPEVMAKNLQDDNYYNCPNSAAVELMPDDYKNNKALNIPQEMKDNHFLQLDLGDAVKVYDEYWTKLLAE